MDEKVKDILNMVKNTAAMVGEAAGRSAATAGKKTGELVESAKINVQIYDLNSEIAELNKEIGAMVYAAHTGAENDDELLQSKLKAIDDKNAQIDELKGRVREMKQVKGCGACDTDCALEDKFCRSCGKEL